MDAAAIKFPALAFAQDTVFVLRGLEEFTTATKAGIRNGFFDGLTIVDSANQKFVVAGATIGSRVGLFASRYRVHPIVSDPSSGPTIEELRSQVLAAMRHPRWSSVYGVEEFADDVRRSPSSAQLIQALLRRE